MTIRGGSHPKPTMVLTPFLRMGPPPRSFAADAHDCIMVRPPLDRPNTRLWRDDPRPMASSPLIVDARLSPSNCARVSGQRSACSGNRDGWSARPSQQGDRAASALRCSQGSRGGKLKLVRQGPERWQWSGRELSRPKSLDIRRPIQGWLDEGGDVEPDPAQDRLQANAGLVRGPDLDRRVRVLGP